MQIVTFGRMKKLFQTLFFLVSFKIFAQLGFCEGSKGDFIFHEDFGQGTTGAPLPTGVTSYSYVTGRDPADGFYTVSTMVGITFSSWHTSFPSTTISNGLVLIVNADDQNAGLFYRREIINLCENTSYEFSAFLMNVHNKSSLTCQNNDIPINVRFEIWDETDSILLKAGSTGNITSTVTPQWVQHALTFQTESGQESIILKMFNNGVGGCGNDLAIDDIVFRSCGDFTEIRSGLNIESPFKLCESDDSTSITLAATPDFSIYTQHSYQWQESNNNQIWVDIEGETEESYTTPVITESKFYRVKVAEDEINLNKNLCSSASEAFHIIFVPTPNVPVSSGNISICGNEPIPSLQVSVENGETVNWFDAPENGNLLAEGTTSFKPVKGGIFYAEAIKPGFNCAPSLRTAVNLTIYAFAEVEDEILKICEGAEILLDAGIEDMDYQWSTGQISKTITVSSAGNFSVVITTVNDCKTTKNFEVLPVTIALIANIVSEESSVIISTTNQGQFEYSLDGVNFQQSNVFESVPGGVYIAYVRDLQNCNTASQKFAHIVIQRFFTPNNDGFNDIFVLKGLEFFKSSYINIFDRYGKIIKAGKGENFTWNGMFENRLLPAADYWYEIYIEDFKSVKGHVSLKR